jgi:hypothetical protein
MIGDFFIFIFKTKKKKKKNPYASS